MSTENKQQLTNRFKKILVLACVASVLLGALITSVTISLFDYAKTVVLDPQAEVPLDLNYSGVEDVYDRLRREYDGQLDQQQLQTGLKRGLVKSIGDPHTVYFSKEEAEIFLDSFAESEFEGIGAYIENRDSSIMIISTFKNSPAEKAGLKSKDFIIGIDDQDTIDMPVEEAITLIKGPAGTEVELKIKRGTSEIFTVKVIRQNISLIGDYYIKDKIGVLSLYKFVQSKTIDLANEAVAEFQKNNVEAIILDLRNNPGGELEETRAIAGLWLTNDDVVVIQKKRSEVFQRKYAVGEAPLAQIPTVVLINQQTASASEIVAGALQDHKAATILGEKSFGKGSVQSIIAMDPKAKDGSEIIKVTSFHWFTPNDKTIEGIGITPDVVVEVDEDDDDLEVDLQFNKALEILKDN